MPSLLTTRISFVSLPDLLRLLAEGGRGGVVTLRGEGLDEAIRIEGGRFTSAALPPGDRAARIIDEAKLDSRAADRLGELLAGSKGRLGPALAKKIVTPEQFAALAAAAVIDAIAAALLAPDADVAIEPLDGSEPPLELTVDDAVAAAEERNRRATAITPSTIFRTAGDLDLDKVTLTAAEVKLLLRVDAKRTVRELAGDAEVESILPHLQNLLGLGLIEKEGERSEGPSTTTTLRGRPAGGFSAACLTLHDADKTSHPLFDPEYSIGRDAANRIAIADPSISGRHATLRRTPAGYEIEDLGSRNGTFVNGERVQRALLRNGDSLRLGKVQMVYTIAGA